MMPQTLRVAVDWDGVCVPNRYPEQPKVWLPGAAEALDELACTAQVFIHSARLNGTGPAAVAEAMYVRGMLDKAGLHHVDIHDHRSGKPGVHLFIDDRALHFRDWESALPEALTRLMAA